MTTTIANTRTDDVPCQFCEAGAVGIYYFDKGCACFPEDRVQALCEQHIDKATPIGGMRLISRPLGVRPLRVRRDYHKEWMRIKRCSDPDYYKRELERQRVAYQAKKSKQCRWAWP